MRANVLVWVKLEGFRSQKRSRAEPLTCRMANGAWCIPQTQDSGVRGKKGKRQNAEINSELPIRSGSPARVTRILRCVIVCHCLLSITQGEVSTGDSQRRDTPVRFLCLDAAIPPCPNASLRLAAKRVCSRCLEALVLTES